MVLGNSHLFMNRSNKLAVIASHIQERYEPSDYSPYSVLPSCEVFMPVGMHYSFSVLQKKFFNVALSKTNSIKNQYMYILVGMNIGHFIS